MAGNKSFSRKKRVENLVRKVLSQILIEEISDPRLNLLEITRVELSADLKVAHVYYSSILSVTDENASNNSEIALRKAAKYLRSELGRRARLKFTPELRFNYDKNVEYADHINQVINKLHDNE